MNEGRNSPYGLPHTAKLLFHRNLTEQDLES